MIRPVSGMQAINAISSNFNKAALESKGYTPVEADRLMAYAPTFAHLVEQQESHTKLYYRALMVVPPLMRFESVQDTSPSLTHVVTRYAGGGVFDPEFKGQYAYLIVEYKLPEGFMQRRNKEATTLTVPIEDARAVMSRVGVLLKEPNMSNNDAPLVFLGIEEAFHLSGPNAGRMKTNVELVSLARTRLAESMEH